MLNKELQDELNIEIDRASIEVQTFLRDKYFTDTLALIGRVNTLNDIQKDALYLEVVMQVLGLNDYTDFADSVRNELKVGEEELPTENIKQIVNDINVYVFDKIKREEKKELSPEVVISPNINGVVGKETTIPTPSLRESIMKKTGVEDKYSIGFLTKPSPVSVETKVAPVIIEKEAVTEKVPEVMPDVYREMPEPVDKTLKHE